MSLFWISPASKLNYDGEMENLNVTTAEKQIKHIPAKSKGNETNKVTNIEGRQFCK